MGDTAKPQILVVGTRSQQLKIGYIPEFVALMQESFEVITFQDLNENPERASGVGGMICRGFDVPYLWQWLPRMPKLKVITTDGKGIDHLEPELKNLAARGIRVANVPLAVANATADHAMTIMLASARNIVSAVHDAMVNPDFRELDVNAYGIQVTGSTLGIVGMGSIGYKIAQRARGFEMKILYHNRTQRCKAEEDAVGATYVAKLSDMLPQCEFVMISCPLTPETNKLFNDEAFRLMRNTATLVNIARGTVVDQEALLRALTQKQIRQAALDVTEPEPLPRDHPLLKLPNLLVTPHIGSATHSTRREMIQTAIANLRAVLIDNTPIPFEVTPPS